MCANAKIGSNTVKPGDHFITHALRGTDYSRWGIGDMHNSRIESLKTIWKSYERIYLHLSGFYEGRGYFELADGLQLTVAGVSDGINFNIVTREAIGIVKPFHGRMPVILADSKMWLIHGVAVEIPPSYLRLVA